MAQTMCNKCRRPKKGKDLFLCDTCHKRVCFKCVRTLGDEMHCLACLERKIPRRFAKEPLATAWRSGHRVGFKTANAKKDE